MHRVIWFSGDFGLSVLNHGGLGGGCQSNGFGLKDFSHRYFLCSPLCRTCKKWLDFTVN